ncbi:MAG: hypothetical protein HYT94_02205 [Parcubacteria group bacterium]|nr:hypothetical protein [Parcubacteria group bacterium]
MNDKIGLKYTTLKKQKGFSFVVFLLLVIISAAAGYTFYQKNVWVKAGDTVYVHIPDLVTVRNMEAIHTNNGTMDYGQACEINAGGMFTVVSVSGQYILVEYSHSTEHQCPNHTLFFLTNDEIKAMQKAEEQKWREVLVEERKLEIVKQFLNGNKKRG